MSRGVPARSTVTICLDVATNCFGIRHPQRRRVIVNAFQPAPLNLLLQYGLDLVDHALICGSHEGVGRSAGMGATDATYTLGGVLPHATLGFVAML